MDPYGLAGPATLPRGIPRLGRAGALASVAALLDNWTAGMDREHVADAIARFGLDPHRPGDVLAARAYTWSIFYVSPLGNDIPYNGPGLDAASQAVMRLTLIDPHAFLAMGQDPQAFRLITTAAIAGYADYVWESRARPKGVEPALQTSSPRARAVVRNVELGPDIAAHHLIPANVWGANVDLTNLAKEDKWHQDSPSNVIGLPITPVAQARLARMGIILPLHNSSHVLYDADTRSLIAMDRAIFKNPPTPLEAKAIFDHVALVQRLKIIAGVYNPIMKLFS